MFVEQPVTEMLTVFSSRKSDGLRKLTVYAVPLLHELELNVISEMLSTDEIAKTWLLPPLTVGFTV